jgi:hypothetical protein
MPRRNRNASPRLSSELLADHLIHLTTELHTVSVTCAACRVNPATTGDYCALCKGTITRAARRDTLARR